jgi:DNA-binding FadR family transcriptional regulator
MIEKIEKENLATLAYRRIKADVLSDKYSEGKKIPSENAYAKALSVSRVVVREALKRLKDEKVIVTYQGKGSFRANPENFNFYQNGQDWDYEKFKEVIDFRGAIEYSAIYLAGENATEQEKLSLINLAKKMHSENGKVEEFSEIDYEFHLSLIKCSHNKMLLSAYQNAKSDIVTALNLMNRLEGSREYAVNLHLEIAVSIRARETKRAVSLLKDNDEYNKARIEQLFNLKK